MQVISVAKLHREDILRRLSNGEYSTHISTSYGLDKSAISQALRGDPDYLQAIEAGHESRLDAVVESIEQAGDDLNLVRAREVLARRLEWRAERECPSRWGKVPTMIVNTGANVSEVIAGLAASLLDQQRTVSIQDHSDIQEDSDEHKDSVDDEQSHGG